MKCPNCGEEVPEGKAFCGHCGQALSESENAVSPSAHETEAPPVPAMRARALYLEAREHWTTGQLDLAEQAYRQSIELTPDLPHPHYDLACLLEAQQGDSADASAHFKRFIELASTAETLAPQVEQARERIQSMAASAAPDDTKDIQEKIRSQLFERSSEEEASGESGTKTGMTAVDHIPTGPATKAEVDRTLLIAEVLIPKTEAIRVVKKGLEGTLIKREQIDDDVRKMHLPLWRVHCRYKKGLLSREIIEEPIYLNAYNGRLMTLEKGGMRFTDIVEVKPHRVADLDNKARFEPARPETSQGEIIPRRVSKEDAMQRVREMFRVETTDAQEVCLPLWQFSVSKKRGEQRRWVFIDTTFGREVYGLSARIEPGATQPFELADAFASGSKPPAYSFPVLDTTLASVDTIRAVRDVAVGTANVAAGTAKAVGKVAAGTATVAAGTAKAVGKVAVGTASTAAKSARAVKSAADDARARSQAKKLARQAQPEGRRWIKRLGCLIVTLAVVFFVFLVLGGAV